MMKKFSEKFMSKISEQFYYMSKTEIECPECQHVLKYGSNIHYAVGLYGPQSLVEALRSFTSNSPSVPAVRKNVYFFRPYSPAYSGNYSTSEYNIRQHLPNYGGQDYDIDETSESYDSGAWNKTVLL